MGSPHLERAAKYTKAQTDRQREVAQQAAAVITAQRTSYAREQTDTTTKG